MIYVVTILISIYIGTIVYGKLLEIDQKDYILASLISN